jgi:hypothetical protein
MGMLVQYSLPYMSEHYSIWILPYITPYTLPIIHIALFGSIYRLKKFFFYCFLLEQ